MTISSSGGCSSYARAIAGFPRKGPTGTPSKASSASSANCSSIGPKSPERTPSLKRSTCDRSNSSLSDFGRLPFRRVRAGARGAVELRPAVERLLRIFHFARVAGPGLQRRRLERAPVRERELPRVRPALVHRVQPRGRVLVALSSREEDDARDRPRNGVAQTTDRLLRDVVH